MWAPAAILLECDLGIVGNLRRSRGERAKNDWRRQHANNQGRAGHDREGQAA
jgi:hypothetical protein